MKNLKSEFCWHIYGLIHKANKNYVEAINCFKQSVKNGNDNVQLARDIANLQLHIRDYDGNLESRKQLLFAKTNLIVNWVAYCVANHLSGNYGTSWRVVESIENMITKDQNNKLKPVEENEVPMALLTL